MASVNSTTFIKRPPTMSDKQESYLYTKELLSGRIFLGYYKERRYVEVLNEYRDVVVVSPEEMELHSDLNKVRSKWLRVTSIKWLGITGPDMVGSSKGYSFWVKLCNIAFGHYWFQIKHIKLAEQELLMNLKCIRKFHMPEPGVLQVSDKTVSKKNNEFPEGETSAITAAQNPWDIDVRKNFSTVCEISGVAFRVIIDSFTWRNLLTVLKVICALALVIIMESISFCGKLGEYLLKLIRELTFLVQAFTPVFIQLIDFFSKVVGGFYILLAGIFIRNGRRPQPQDFRNNLRSISYSDAHRPPPMNLPTDWRERNRILRQELLSNTQRK